MASRNFHKRRTQDRKARQAKARHIKHMIAYCNVHGKGFHKHATSLSIEDLQRRYDYLNAGRKY